MVKTCERCGAAFDTHPGKVRYCHACREDIREQKNAKKQANKGHHHNCDSPERIAICLNCKMPPNRCTGNCETIRMAAAKYERKG